MQAKASNGELQQADEEFPSPTPGGKFSLKQECLVRDGAVFWSSCS